ncbi:ABC transporter substrate-binding protein [Alicyclobacillus kakegawensis]|uniref:ABC transporter substrate-binding protein n=1 Tax=Alicyclobacillus kakegawensis TaxID=392012 RepID=UPI0008300BB9|nr:ABC transporter substrate-binding protein [Alicyclobacillus kakegawensis]
MRKQRYLGAIFAALLTVVVSGCGTASTNSQSSSAQTSTNNGAKTNKVIIGVYGGSWEQEIRSAALNDFQKRTGIKVVVVPGTDADWFAKVRAANGKNPPYDILVLQPDTINRLEGANLLQPLDSKHVPNLAHLYASATDHFTKDGKVYAAGFSYGQLGIAYRKDYVHVPPSKWTNLWNPRYKGHVAVSPLTYAAGLQFFAGIVHATGGQLSNPSDVQKAFQKLGQLRNNVVAYPSDPGTIQTLLQRGNAWLVPEWDGRAYALQQQGLDVGFVYPKDGPVAAISSWAIMKGSPNLANAYKLLNYLLSPQVEGKFAQQSFYGMSNKDVQYSSDFKKKIHVGDAYYNKLLWVDYSVVTPNLAQWTNEWSQVMGEGK